MTTDKVCFINSTKDLSVIECTIVKRRMLVKDQSLCSLVVHPEPSKPISPTSNMTADQVCVINSKKDLSVVECIIVKRRMLVKDPQPLFIGSSS